MKEKENNVGYRRWDKNIETKQKKPTDKAKQPKRSNNKQRVYKNSKQSNFDKNKKREPKNSPDKIYKQITQYQKEIDELLKEDTIEDEMKIYVLATNLLGLRVEQLSKIFVSMMDKV